MAGSYRYGTCFGIGVRPKAESAANVKWRSNSIWPN